ncbi:hypothetical protein CRYUN_Cryun24cG0076900 [Craigia yunnanensis]
MSILRNGGGNGHIILSSGVQPSPIASRPASPSTEENQVRANNYKKVVRYKECLKNHAAAIGGNATDGCGEFMPNGEEGSIEAIKVPCSWYLYFLKGRTGSADYNVLQRRVCPSETDEKDDGGEAAARPSAKLRKRFRTKFSQEQKEKMFNFAEKAGWRIQKLGESVVQQFCQENGIKRRVPKVWMHNYKQSLAKKDNISAG